MEEIRLNLVPQREVVNVSCSSWYNEQGVTGDEILRVWRFVIGEGDYPYWRIDAADAFLVCNNRTYPATISNRHDYVDVVVPVEISSKPGRYDAKLLFEKGDEKLYSAAFTIWVEGL